MLHKRCNTDMLGVLLIYLHSPSGAAQPQDRVYTSVKPLAAVLQPINVSTCIHTCIHTYIHAYGTAQLKFDTHMHVSYWYLTC